jgi:hypothetical protein
MDARICAPLLDRFVGDDDSTGKQQLFDVAIAEAEAIVQPDAMADDFGRETIMFVRICWCASQLPGRSIGMRRAHSSPEELLAWDEYAMPC